MPSYFLFNFFSFANRKKYAVVAAKMGTASA
jgi:hypothetical protein